MSTWTLNTVVNGEADLVLRKKSTISDVQQKIVHSKYSYIHLLIDNIAQQGAS